MSSALEPYLTASFVHPSHSAGSNEVQVDASLTAPYYRGRQRYGTYTSTGCGRQPSRGTAFLCGNHLPLPRYLGFRLTGQTTCSAQLSPTYGCQPDTSCFCTRSQLSAALEACITANCTIPEGIAAKKFQADTCNYPVRSQVDTGEGVLWAFFTIAIIFSTLRCASRCRMLGGAGYWWDDWICLVCVLPMIGISITGSLGYQHGIGRDYWEVGASGIEESARVSVSRCLSAHLC